MSRGVPYSVCRRCGRAAFPPRALCPDCGGARWRREWAREGVLEEATTLRHAPGVSEPVAVRLATIRLHAGPRLIARLEGEASAGERVALETIARAPLARASLAGKRFGQ